MVDPTTCIFASTTKRVGDHVYCAGHEAWTECQAGHWGEPPMCSWDEPDNGPEAMARRVAWMGENG